MLQVNPETREWNHSPAVITFWGMGATHVTVAISNPADPKRRWEALFLVDIGAIDCMAPASRLHDFDHAYLHAVAA